MSREKYKSTKKDEIRILILIDRFTTPKGCLRGRTKLAKLDFFLRYPKYLNRAVFIRNKDSIKLEKFEEDNIDNRMVRYKYGPWDPSYYSVLGNLIGKGLVDTVKTGRGVGYITTESGKRLVDRAKEINVWKTTDERTRVLKRNLDLTGSFLKDFIYDNFPEVTNAEWGEKI